MKIFSATTLAGQIEFCGDNWEEGGFVVDSEGNPKCDCKRNGVRRFAVREATSEDASLLKVAFAGDDRIESPSCFLSFLTGEVGMDLSQAKQVCAKLGVAITPEDWRCLEEGNQVGDLLRKNL
jgi:hypothetical protein